MKGTLRLALLNFLLFVYLLFHFLFSQIQSELSNSFSTIFLNTSEDACRMP